MKSRNKIHPLALIKSLRVLISKNKKNDIKINDDTKAMIASQHGSKSVLFVFTKWGVKLFGSRPLVFAPPPPMLLIVFTF